MCVAEFWAGCLISAEFITISICIGVRRRNRIRDHSVIECNKCNAQLYVSVLFRLAFVYTQ